MTELALLCTLVMLLIISCCALLFRILHHKLYGGHASLIKPYTPTTLSAGTELSQLFIKFNSVYPPDIRIIDNSHHVPIYYGTNTKMYVHGVPIDGFKSINKQLYNIIRFHEPRIMFSLTASTIQNDQRAPVIEHVNVVMLPKRAPASEITDERILAKMLEYEEVENGIINNNNIDFAYLPYPENPFTMRTLYKFNTLPKGELRFQDTFETIYQNLNDPSVKRFVFTENFCKTYREYKNMVQKFDTYGSLKYHVVRTTEGTWELKAYLANNVEIHDEALMEVFSQNLVNSNYYDYLGKDGKISNLEYIENDINNGFDLLRYYTNVPLHVLAQDLAPSSHSE